MNMNKMLAIPLGAVLVLLMMALPTAAQDSKEGAAPTPEPSAAKSGTAYQLDFKLNEIENGKRINSRSYSMLGQAGGALNKLRLGARVPVPIGSFHSDAQNALVSTQFQYMDAGMNIDCRLQEQEGALGLSVVVDSSSFTSPSSDSPVRQPVVNQLRFELSTIINLGKPTVLTTVDDPSSKRQFQLEVTATKTR